MRTVTTSTGETFRITSNKSKRTFTIRTDYAKYRTIPMPKDEFESAQYWTGNDWAQYFKTDEYYKVR